MLWIMSRVRDGSQHLYTVLLKIKMLVGNWEQILIMNLGMNVA